MQGERLSLPEEFSLLAFVQESGAFKRKMFQAGEFYTAAGCVMELFYRGIIAEKDGKLVLVDFKRTGLQFLDIIIDVLSKEKKNRTLHHWLMNLSARGLRTRHHVTNHLVQKKILKPIKRRVLYLIPVKGFTEVRPMARKETLERLREKLLGNAPIDEKTLGLALLLKQAKVLKHHFSEPEVPKIENGLEKLQSEGEGSLSFQLAKTIHSAYKTLGATKWESLGI